MVFLATPAKLFAKTPNIEFSAFWADFQENGSRLAQNGSQNPMGYVWKMYQKSDYTCRQAVLTMKLVSTHLLAF